MVRTLMKRARASRPEGAGRAPGRRHWIFLAGIIGFAACSSGGDTGAGAGGSVGSGYGDVRSCGPSGDVCPIPPGSYPICVSDACDIRCNDGFDDCDQERANGCEASLASDANNCSRCGRGCLGGTCEMGVCAPIMIASSQDHPQSIVINGSVAYWTNAGKYDEPGLGWAPTEGGGAVSALGSDVLGNTWGIAVDANNLYWTANDGSQRGLYWTSRAAPGNFFKLAGGTVTRGLAVDAKNAYWAEQNDEKDGSGQVLMVPLAGGDVVTVASNQSRPRDVVVDESRVYWTSGGEQGAVMISPLAAPSPTPLAEGQNEPSGLALFDSKIYWASSGAGQILSAPKAGGAVTVLASDQHQPVAVAVDASGVYWATHQGEIVVLRNEPGSAPVLLATGQSRPEGIALDDKAVYWTSAEAGVIMKVAR